MRQVIVRCAIDVNLFFFPYHHEFTYSYLLCNTYEMPAGSTCVHEFAYLDKHSL